MEENKNLKFGHVKKGDKVIRLLGGKVRMELIVGDVDDEIIYCGSSDGLIPVDEGWKFRRQNGAEVDEDLGWDGINFTGSVLSKD